jgi:UDP-GlcNAc:undecaprenyl-phosphate GlcNAc-1-phosphate transferase
MSASLWYASASTLLLSLATHRLGIPLAHRFGLLDVPNPRKVHARATPIVGGICILLASLGGLSLYLALDPAFWTKNQASLLTLLFCVSLLISVGVVDDVKGLGPRPKMGFQALAAIACLAFEPHVHQFCLNWQTVMGPIIWPAAAIWLIGITNAVNLIDGLDGLAGGTSLLVCSSILLLNLTNGSDYPPTVLMALLIPAVFSFLTVNWNPARMFLGDNGSLTLGFLIASSSLMVRPSFDISTSWIASATVLLMMGYPILDMGLAVRRRYQKGLPLFKADRNHLHYRIQRLGLSVRETSSLLLSISFYLQIAALALNFVSPWIAALGIGLSFLSIFSMLYVIRAIEKSRVAKLSAEHAPTPGTSNVIRLDPGYHVLNIELAPLYEVGLMEERVRCGNLVQSLEAMVKAMVRSTDEVVRSHDRLSIILRESLDTDASRKLLIERFSKKLEKFSELMELQTSLSSLPITLSRDPSVRVLTGNQDNTQDNRR